MSCFFAIGQLNMEDGSGFNQWICGQVAAVTGASLTHQTSPHFQDTSEIMSDDGPVTPGDDDDDEDDKDKVSITGGWVGRGEGGGGGGGGGWFLSI